MKIVICDDDKAFADELYNFLLEFFVKQKLEEPQIKKYYCGEDLLESKDIPDIAFLDVEMEGLSGIYTGRELLYRNPKLLIFIVTSHEGYLDEALRYNVFRYLPKPLQKVRLFRNLRDAVKIYTTSNTKIAIETKEGTIVLRAPQIISFESEGHKLYVNTVKGRFLSVKKMDFWEQTLNMNYYFRSHKSFIVNLEHVYKFDHSTIEMDDGSKAYIARRKYSDFKRAFLLYLEGTKT